MLNSMHPDIVKMPAAMITGGEGIADKIPSADRVPSNEELETRLLGAVRSDLKDIEVSDVMQQIDPAFSLDKFVNGPDGVFDTMKYASTPPKSPARDFFAEGWKGLAYTGIPYAGRLQNFIEQRSVSSQVWRDLRLDRSQIQRSPQACASFIKALATSIRNNHNAMVNSFASSEVAKAREAALQDVDWLSVRSS